MRKAPLRSRSARTMAEIDCAALVLVAEADDRDRQLGRADARDLDPELGRTPAAAASASRADAGAAARELNLGQ